MDIPSNFQREFFRWNWGAFLLTPLWCLRHQLWLYFFIWLLPVVGFIIPFLVGAQGNRKAWEKNPGEHLEDFLARQRFWTRCGLWIWGSILFSIVLFVVLALLLA